MENKLFLYRIFHIERSKCMRAINSRDEKPFWAMNNLVNNTWIAKQQSEAIDCSSMASRRWYSFCEIVCMDMFTIWCLLWTADLHIWTLLSQWIIWILRCLFVHLFRGTDSGISFTFIYETWTFLWFSQFMYTKYVEFHIKIWEIDETIFFISTTSHMHNQLQKNSQNEPFAKKKLWFITVEQQNHIELHFHSHFRPLPAGLIVTWFITEISE